MYKALSASNLGHPAVFKEAAEVTAKTGYEGYLFSIMKDSQTPAEETIELLQKYNLKPAGFSLPFDFRGSKEAFEDGMANFENLVKYAAKIGANRCATYIMPFHDTLNYAENFELHRSRLTEACKVMKEYGIIFGMEFVSSPDLLKDKKHLFIHDLPKMLELCDAIGTGNVGILMDLWHWDFANHTKQDIVNLKCPDMVALVHINDAPAGVPRDEQKDFIRKLPGETGVLRIAEFFEGLKELGYKGPVVVEPFEPKLKEMSFEDAIVTNMAALNKVWPK